jgi:hypothetical protein
LEMGMAMDTVMMRQQPMKDMVLALRKMGKIVILFLCCLLRRIIAYTVANKL